MGLLIFICCLVPTVLFAILLAMHDRKYVKLEKENDELRKAIADMYQSNSERIAVKIDFEPAGYQQDPAVYVRMIAERASRALMHKMIGHCREKLMTHFIKCMTERKYFWYSDVITLRNWVYISVPVYRLDYDLIQVGRDHA